MPAFSYTQPIFTIEDQEREIADLTAEERESILDDMRGRLLQDITEEEVRMQQQQQQQVEEDNFDDIDPGLSEQFSTEMDKIPFEDKAEYLQALATNEALFETECNPIRFLRYTNYDSETAAVRMTKYWKMRVKLFGEERAYLPMTLSGAMQEDVEVWRTQQLQNYVYYLPNDAKGRSVLCVVKKYISDRQNLPRYILNRIAWYMLHLALNKRRFTQMNGIVVITIQQLKCLNQFDRLNTKINFQLVRDCVPIKICALHCIASGVYQRFVGPAVQSLMSKQLRTRAKMHDLNISNSDLIQDLHEYGLRREGLPTKIGGSHEVNPNWLQEQLESEEN